MIAALRASKAAACACCVASSLAAQEPDSLPFRPGQWASVFQVSAFDNFAGIGVLRFSDARRAWLLDGRLAGTSYRDRFEQTDTTSATLINRSQRSFETSVRLGRRRFRAIGPSLVAFRTFGLTASLATFRGSDSRGSDASSTDWRGGLFADLGAAYLPTRRLSVGFTTTVAASYGRQRRDDDYAGVSRTSNGWTATAGVTLVTLIATLYF